MRRWPSCMKTIAAMIASARKGIMTLKIWSGLFHHLLIPLGIPEAMEAKIISEMPLPIPRWVISSPSHMSRTQPAVRVITITKTRPKVKFSTTSALPLENVRKRNT
jgi:hypothetical protein